MWSITVLLLLCTKNVFIIAAPKNISSQDLDKEVKNKQWSFDTNILICKPCECGVGYPGSRIVGGAEAKENEYPWMVSLWNAKKKFFCGGSIITDQYVLTAAHCFSEDPASNFREIYVMLGHTKRPDRLILGYSNVIKASLVKLHHNYDPEGISIHDNDIALVKLAKPVKFDQTLRTLCLPKKRLDYSGLSGVVAGWGQISETSSTSLNLRRATVPIWSEKDCSVIPEYEKPGYTSNMLCAGYKNGGIDSCQGDSGGPLMVYDNNDKTTVAGIVSWGIGCGAPKLPGVYTRVDNYIDWIMKHTKDSCHCSN
ncbi:trypsin-1-like isoform X2 [Daktulosphaira vitifoliae]|uniref:trypsin-1-like isoform X2 n=1 Tax=Daktulosphaira vitifoliae TaxID=58002 RepID=UPI0021AAF559|nr:trypsin-1-like isoform X2 [Daktulosphaira vitifoliae]XP_050536394.1 trypsin-1-like isoform X2 [Daktulosphaira vitifoliae]XP_050536395.1 trypsin-1-like isoform X2 [Daktulosphaira vitifoliae]XP_050536396.1 trypsin-1-like isoform X2 [Daktulosphaira vitifoliae]